MTHAEALTKGGAMLASARIGEPGLDARLLLQHATGLDHAGLISAMPHQVAIAAMDMYELLLARRAAREPVHRIAGRRLFFGLEFAVTPFVLDPRPETELLVERVLGDYAPGKDRLNFADVGAGSGAIGIALLTKLQASRCVATDTSKEALAVATRNAAAHGVGQRFHARRTSYLEGVAGRFDFIVSNPPYVASGEIGGLDPEVRLFDPLAALDGGPDGLDGYRALLGKAGSRLAPRGRLYLEFGAGQAAAIRKLAALSGWRIDGVHCDLAGVERVMVALTG